MSRAPRLGVLGGTFDPVHHGHLRMARAASAACGLDRVYFVPAAHPWHKAAPEAGYADRYAMLALALQGSPQWQPLDLTLDIARESARARAATYSVDQMRRIHRLHPHSRLFFIVGADAWATLPSWKQPQTLLKLCDIIVLARAGFNLDDMIAALPPRFRPVRRPPQRSGAAVQRVRLPGGSSLFWLGGFADRISSTSARQWLTAATDPRRPPAPIPAAVAAYARRAHLYSHG